MTISSSSSSKEINLRSRMASRDTPFFKCHSRNDALLVSNKIFLPCSPARVSDIDFENSTLYSEFPFSNRSHASYSRVCYRLVNASIVRRSHNSFKSPNVASFRPAKPFCAASHGQQILVLPRSHFFIALGKETAVSAETPSLVSKARIRAAKTMARA